MTKFNFVGLTEEEHGLARAMVETCLVEGYMMRITMNPADKSIPGFADMATL